MTDGLLGIGVIVTLAIATGFDLASRRIPNWLTIGGAVVALSVNVARTSDLRSSLLTSVEGWGLGVLLLAIPFAIRGMGAGDVKLLAAVGAWAGPAFAFHTALLGVLTAGGVALALLIIRGELFGVLRPVATQAWTGFAFAISPIWPGALATVPSGGVPVAIQRQAVTRTVHAIPFAPALAIGGLVALIMGAT